MNFWLKATLVFFAAGVTDALWTYYIKHTSLGNVWRATISSSFLVFASAFVTVEYVNDRQMVLIAALGAAVGTFALMKLDKKNETQI